MKKILYMLLCILMLVGCTHQSNTGTSASTSNSDLVVTTTTPAVTTTTNYPKLEYHDQIMKGDFSSIAGEYINPTTGDIANINNQGLRENETTDGEVYYVLGMYQMGIFPKESEHGYMLTVYPIGIGIFGGLDNLNTSKIRISYGQTYPTEEEIYYKKEE